MSCIHLQSIREFTILMTATVIFGYETYCRYGCIYSGISCLAQQVVSPEIFADYLMCLSPPYIRANMHLKCFIKFST